MPTRRRILVSLLVVLLAALPARALETFPVSELTIVTAGGRHQFKIEVATTEAQLEQGLMFRRNLAPDSGMLFDFKTPVIVTMWMKNTLIPLDMVFVDQQGKIVDIRERAVPESLDIIAAKLPARVVIELNGGTVSRLGIKPGDRVVYSIFGNAS